MHLNGKTFKKSFEVKILQEIGSRTELLMILRTLDPRAHMPHPRAIYM